MKREKEDRRVRITKQAIRESLVELMQEHPISKISVKMICEAADINRSTFYAHYSDQYDLLRQVQQEAVATFKVQLLNRRFTEQTDEAISVLVEVLEHAKANAELFRVLLGDNGDSSFQNELSYIAQEKTIQEIREDRRMDARTAKYVEIFSIYGCLSILRKWLDDGCVDDPRVIAEMITKLLFQGILAFYQ